MRLKNEETDVRFAAKKRGSLEASAAIVTEGSASFSRAERGGLLAQGAQGHEVGGVQVFRRRRFYGRRKEIKKVVASAMNGGE